LIVTQLQHFTPSSHATSPKITHSQQAMTKTNAKAVLEVKLTCLLSCLGKHNLLVLQHVHNLITRTCLGIRDQARASM